METQKNSVKNSGMDWWITQMRLMHLHVLFPIWMIVLMKFKICNIIWIKYFRVLAIHKVYFQFHWYFLLQLLSPYLKLAWKHPDLSSHLKFKMQEKAAHILIKWTDIILIGFRNWHMDIQYHMIQIIRYVRKQSILLTLLWEILAH